MGDRAMMNLVKNKYTSLTAPPGPPPRGRKWHSGGPGEPARGYALWNKEKGEFERDYPCICNTYRHNPGIAKKTGINFTGDWVICDVCDIYVGSFHRECLLADPEVVDVSYMRLEDRVRANMPYIRGPEFTCPVCNTKQSIEDEVAQLEPEAPPEPKAKSKRKAKHKPESSKTPKLTTELRVATQEDGTEHPAASSSADGLSSAQDGYIPSRHDSFEVRSKFCQGLSDDECRNNANICKFVPLHPKVPIKHVKGKCRAIDFSELSATSPFGSEEFRESTNARRYQQGLGTMPMPLLTPYDAGSVAWGSEMNEMQLNTIVDTLKSGVPVVCKVAGIPEESLLTFSETEMVNLKPGLGDETDDGRKLWHHWMRNDSETNGNAQLTTLKEKDEHGKRIWAGVCKTFKFGDQYDLTGVTIVGNIIYKKRPHPTAPHWHGPAVINLHLYGATKKTYRLLDFETAKKYDAHLDDRASAVNFDKACSESKCYGAEIGNIYMGHYNCIMWPPQMIHHVVTSYDYEAIPRSPSDISESAFFDHCNIDKSVLMSSKLALASASWQLGENTLLQKWKKWLPTQNSLPQEFKERALRKLQLISEFETPKKQLYLGIGTYFHIESIPFLQHAAECMQESEAYPSWTKQLDETRRLKFQTCYSQRGSSSSSS